MSDEKTSPRANGKLRREDLVEFRIKKALKGEQYDANYMCINCGTEKRIKIEKGVMIAEANVVCDKCGCSQDQIGRYFRATEKPIG